MPTVPQYNRRVQSDVGPSTRVSTNAPDGAFGVGGLGAIQSGISAISSEVNRVFTEEKKKADSLRYSAADLSLGEYMQNDLILNPDDGLMTKKGANAVNVSPDYLKKFDEKYKEIDKTLVGDDQKQALALSYQQRRAAFASTLAKHELGERESFDSEVTKGRLDLAAREAVTGSYDLKNVEASLDKQEIEIRNQAARGGKNEDWIRSQYQAREEDTLAAATLQMIQDGRTGQASSYFNQNKERFGLNAGKIQSALKTASRDRTENVGIALANLLDRGVDYKDLPRNLIEQVPYTTRTGLKEYGTKVKSGADTPDDETFYRLRLMATNAETREEFNDINLPAYYGKLSKEQRNTIESLRANTRAGKDKDESSTSAVLQSFKAINGTAMNTLKESGVNPDKDPKEAIRFFNKLEQQVIQEEKETGKMVTTQRREELARGMVYEGITEGKYFGTNKKKAYELKTGESFIPDKESESKIKQTLSKYGKEPSKENIRALHMMLVNKGKI